MLMSWGAEEYGMIGSTEFVEVGERFSSNKAKKKYLRNISMP
jgi:Zn-dependent M28 family amino/carboxypeptidase